MRLCCHEVLVWNGLGTDRAICFSSGVNPAMCWVVGWAGAQLLPLYMMLGHGKYWTVHTLGVSACPLARSSPLDLCNYIPMVNFTCSAKLCCLKEWYRTWNGHIFAYKASMYLFSWCRCALCYRPLDRIVFTDMAHFLWGEHTFVNVHLKLLCLKVSSFNEAQR